MSRIVFDNERPVAEVDPGRADVACFVGLLRCNPGATISKAMQNWLSLQGWIGGPFARIFLSATGAAVPVTDCFDVPLPIETYPTFTALFDTGGTASSFGTDYVATAVRTFFAQGGKRCYVIRMGDPVVPKGASELPAGVSVDDGGARAAKLQKMLPSSVLGVDDQTGWHGAGHLAGLPEVSFLAMPDLPILTASDVSGAAGAEPNPATGPEQFTVCSNEDVTPETPLSYGPFAPRLLLSDYSVWKTAVWTVLQYLSTYGSSLREVQFVAAFPMPQDSDPAFGAKTGASEVTDIHTVVALVMPETVMSPLLSDGISTAFLQLTYPWLRTTGSSVLLEGLEPPDGALIGILARNALTRGTFTSATKITPAEIYDVSPILPAQETTVPVAPPGWGPNANPSIVKPLIERFSLFGFTPAGLTLLSDVTTYPGESYRPASIHRLVGVILRACRNLGQDVVFRQNGPALWVRVQTFLRTLMTRLWQANALEGASASDAFLVRCDRSTMTQNDLDNGRLVAVVSFNAASTIELIHVTLALQTSGTSSQTIAQLAEAS